MPYVLVLVIAIFISGCATKPTETLNVKAFNVNPMNFVVLNGAISTVEHIELQKNNRPGSSDIVTSQVLLQGIKHSNKAASSLFYSNKIMLGSSFLEIFNRYNNNIHLDIANETLAAMKRSQLLHFYLFQGSGKTNSLHAMQDQMTNKLKKAGIECKVKEFADANYHYGRGRDCSLNGEEVPVKDKASTFSMLCSNLDNLALFSPLKKQYSDVCVFTLYSARLLDYNKFNNLVVSLVENLDTGEYLVFTNPHDTPGFVNFASTDGVFGTELPK